MEFVGILTTVRVGEHLANRRIGVGAVAGCVRHLHGTRLEVDVQGGAVVDAADIADQHAVDEHPYVIVALEVEGHRLVVDDAVDRLHELRLGMHAEVMVQHGVPRRNLVRQRPVGVLEHVFGRVEGEKLTNGAAPFRPHTRSVVQGHGI